jgi:hypothetical protein
VGKEQERNKSDEGHEKSSGLERRRA